MLCPVPGRSFCERCVPAPAVVLLLPGLARRSAAERLGTCPCWRGSAMRSCGSDLLLSPLDRLFGTVLPGERFASPPVVGWVSFRELINGSTMRVSGVWTLF